MPIRSGCTPFSCRAGHFDSTAIVTGLESATAVPVDPGLRHHRIPFKPGPQRFELWRAGKAIAAAEAPSQIEALKADIDLLFNGPIVANGGGNGEPPDDD